MSKLPASDWLLVFFKGMAMGAADVVPGVSGGTIAFITGIYSRLIGAISRVDAEFIKLFCQFRWRAAWIYLDATFLLVLFLGIATSIFSLAHVVSYLLVAQPVLLWSFFVGLVVASSVLLLRAIQQWNIGAYLLLLVGLALALVVNQLQPSELQPSLPYVFVCGLVAICAMLLPGISGSFLLLVFGVYGFVLEAIKSLDLMVILVFGSGAVTGILSFSKVLNWALTHYHNQVLSFLTGVLIGSIALIWPWQVITTNLELNTTVSTIVMPWEYTAKTGENHQGLFAIVLMLVSAGFVLWLGKFKAE